MAPVKAGTEKAEKKQQPQGRNTPGPIRKDTKRSVRVNAVVVLCSIGFRYAFSS